MLINNARSTIYPDDQGFDSVGFSFTSEIGATSRPAFCGNSGKVMTPCMEYKKGDTSLGHLKPHAFNYQSPLHRWAFFDGEFSEIGNLGKWGEMMVFPDSGRF